MARRRGRRMAMAAAGLATAAPLLLGHQVAGAAQTTASDEDRLTFVTLSGQAVTCTASISARHDTDDPNQPKLIFSSSVGGVASCINDVGTEVTATYRDSEGVTRTVTYRHAGTTQGSITGAYTATTVSARVSWSDCDASQSATCDLTVTASPK